MWGGPLSGNRYAVIFFNRGQSEVNITLSIKNELKLDYVSYTSRDPVRHEDIPVSTNDILNETVKSHCV